MRTYRIDYSGALWSIRFWVDARYWLSAIAQGWLTVRRMHPTVSSAPALTFSVTLED